MQNTSFHRARARVVALPATTVRRVVLSTAAFGTVAACALGAVVTNSWAAPKTLTAAAQASLENAELVASVTPAPAEPVVFDGASIDEIPVTGGTEVSVEGTDLTMVAAVAVDGDEVEIIDHADDAIAFEMPAADAGRTGDVDVTFLDEDGEEIPVVDPAAVVDNSASVAGTELVQVLTEDGALAPVADEADDVEAAESQADAADAADALVLTYVADPAIEKQMRYVMKYWKSYNSAKYIVISGADCANFTSQSLAARGWEMDSGWNYSAAGYSPSWISSTALRDYLATQTDRATNLGSERSQVKVGDIAQFDWDNSGDRDHTTIVSRVEHTSAGTKIWVAGHTKDTDYWNVDEAIASGGSVYFWSIH
ncbi:amidase domain-containing protein [Agromyces rhizosphaerae]|uniref:amidase domain-containing protein n=1 Tax=Agromyces rhizosphaerae TaxID=88374 RepID=UPI0024911DA0|nr:amidase domain-containing protein [Agromyces rhizosphaerae]